MNRDLEEQLSEMGPEYRAVVARLRAAREADQFCRSGRTGVAWKSACLIAASLLVILGLGVVLCTSQPLDPSTSQPAYGAHEYKIGIDEMIATQNPDGSWQNDFLTRRNADALKFCGDPAAQVAYRKAMRNLRVRGVL